MPFTLHEPFPTTYTHHASIPFGRGGAGNRTSTTPSSSSKPLPPSSLAAAATNNTTTSHAHTGPSYSTGRGGAGNMHNSSSGERTVFHFDEELEQEKRRLSNAAPVYHVGRGGTGNTITATTTGSERRGSESSGSGSEKGSKKSLEWVKGVVGGKK